MTFIYPQWVHSQLYYKTFWLLHIIQQRAKGNIKISKSVSNLLLLEKQIHINIYCVLPVVFKVIKSVIMHPYWAFHLFHAMAVTFSEMCSVFTPSTNIDDNIISGLLNNIGKIMRLRKSYLPELFLSQQPGRLGGGDSRKGMVKQKAVCCPSSGDMWPVTSGPVTSQWWIQFGCFWRSAWPLNTGDKYFEVMPLV